MSASTEPQVAEVPTELDEARVQLLLQHRAQLMQAALVLASNALTATFPNMKLVILGFLPELPASEAVVAGTAELDVVHALFRELALHWDRELEANGEQVPTIALPDGVKPS